MTIKVYGPRFNRKPLYITGMDLCPCCGKPHAWMPREWQKAIAKRVIFMTVALFALGMLIGHFV